MDYKTVLYQKKNKYNAVKQTYGGYSYDSKLEAQYAALLDTLKKASKPSERVVSYDRQVKVSLDVNGKHIANYYVDFFVTYADHHQAWIEIKGYETNEYKLKAKLFKALYPDRIYVVIR